MVKVEVRRVERHPQYEEEEEEITVDGEQVLKVKDGQWKKKWTGEGVDAMEGVRKVNVICEMKCVR